MAFTHLHGHSQYSLLEAIGSTKSILAKLKELGCTHAPLMDYHGMYNAITHYEMSKKEGLIPIIGVDLGIQLYTQGKSIPRIYYMTLIAKNYDGYITLLDIVSRAHTKSVSGEPVLGLSFFPETNNNLLALIHGYETPVGEMIQAGRSEEDIIQTILSYEEVLGKGNIVLEVIPQSPKDNPQLAHANTVLRSIHEKTMIPIICTSNFHYINKEDKEAYDIARCIKDGKRVYDEDRRKTFGEFHIMSEEEIRTQCDKNGFTESQIQKMIDTTEKIADMITIEIPLHKILFPVYESPEEIKELYKKFQQA